MLQIVVAMANQNTSEVLQQKAKRILAEGCCGSQFKWDFFCRLCPICWTCEGPDRIPFNHLKEYLRHNEKLPVDDDKYNKDVDLTKVSISDLNCTVIKDQDAIVDASKSYTLNISPDRSGKCT